MARRSILLATRKGLFTATETRRGFAVTDVAFVGVPVSMVLPDARDGALYAALDHGHFGVKLHRRDGARWKEVATPAYPQLRKGKVETDQFGRPWPRKLRLVWSLELDPRTPGALWCGTIPGGLFHSADRAASWQFQDALWNMAGRTRWFGGGYDVPGIHSILVDPRDANAVTLGVSCGGVPATRDGGRTWRNEAHGLRAAFSPSGKQFDPDIQDPHRLAFCRSAPDRIWCQHHNGIFVRGAAGKPFREVKAKAPSRFGFACAAHPVDCDIAWFVPAVKDECRVPVDARVVVTRTSDGGKTLDVLHRGLPQHHAYDLVYRHGLEVARDGATLAMASTSGRVWIGHDGGEQWRELAANLPPVYAVRWQEG